MAMRSIPKFFQEGEVSDADTFVALTNDDEVNVLSALLARRFGAAHTVALINVSSFVPLISTSGWTVSSTRPRSRSSILKHVRRGRIRDIHTIIEDKGEIMEVEAMPSSPMVGLPLRSAKLPKYVSIGAIVRGDDVIAPRGDTIVEPNDRVILFAERHAISDVEKILSVRPISSDPINPNTFKAGLFMSRIAYVNGRYVPHKDAEVSIDDRGLSIR